MTVGHRRHVDDAEPFDQLGVPQRQQHRDLAAHRVADQRDRVVGAKQPGHLVGGLDVVEAVGPRRPAVVGHVDEQHPVVLGERLGDRWSSSCPARTARGRRRPASPVAQRRGVQAGCASRDGHGPEASRRDLDRWLACRHSVMPCGILSTSGGRRPRSGRGRGARRRAGRPVAAGPAEVLVAVLDREHPLAVVVDVRTALAPAGALLRDREVEADRGPSQSRRGSSARRRGRRGGATRPAWRANAFVSARVDQAVAAGERVEVVELDGGVAVVGAAVDPAADDAGQLAPLLGGADVEQPLAPGLVDDRAAVLLAAPRSQCWRQNRRSLGWVWKPLT